MNDKNKSNMYKLLRDIGDVQGIARTTILALESFIKSIHELECSQDEVQELYLELADAIKNSQPKIIPLIHLIERFEKEMRHLMKNNPSIDEIREKAEASLREQIDLFKGKAAQVTENGLKYVSNGDRIIVHSASSVVTNILIRAKKDLKLLFRVIILDHNKERTRQLIQAFSEHDIEYQVTRAYDISHYIETANKMFLGALTITSDRKIVAPTGTAGTVSMCHLHNIKVHLFANTLHYSHGKATDQYIYEEESSSASSNIHFPVTTHSHDVINLDIIDHIVNENGELEKQAVSEE
ncbi:hypothetical protein MTBBW1_1640011 [Desulfamplus magnetovallimortis]|uniref:Translation initiation factor eIF2B subunit delta n=1 Tax=Desulfamplus magnetovallimortis TaxID=1246637 RepID=A0A1W1H941_9BACT|nr:hypothetical protein [Desulfamplus magnetovallimortis]SLM28956.1 hypothetical protein MTBBW1_1640011 [Desulfamplus magnetovallimortis]